MILQKGGRAMSRMRGRSWSRREFLGGATLGGMAGLIGLWPPGAAAEPPPETTRIRFRRVGGSICVAPLYVAEDLLRAEGFTDVQYLARADVGTAVEAVSAGRIDLAVNVFLEHMAQLDAGDPVMALAGIHGGCYELIGNGRVRNLRDLKGKTVAVDSTRSVNTSVAKTRSAMVSSGLSHSLTPVQAIVSTGSSPTTQASWPAGMSISDIGPASNSLPSLSRTCT